jgi:hypothetical protein
MPTLPDSAHAAIPFDEAYLHDAVLKEFRVHWDSRTCEVHVSAFLDVGKAAVPCVIRGQGIRSVTIPHHSPWGESRFINGHRRSPDGRFLIEVQSGDVIEIDAMSLDLFRVIAE